MSPALKRAAGVAGMVLCLVAAALLLKRGLTLGESLGERLTRIAPAALAAACVLYVAGALLLGWAWVLLVRTASAAALRAKPLYVAHLRSQLAKYLPGNLFHLAYRHLAARRQEVSHGALGGALALESVLLIAAAAMFATGVASDPRLGELGPWAHWVAKGTPLLAIAAGVGVAWAIRRFAAAGRPLRRVLPAFAATWAVDVVFFALAAAALRLLCLHPQALPFPAWCGWLALAWVIGYVTPGAPGGLGLREAVLAFGLAPALGEAEAMAVALSYRLVTVAADALLAGLGFVLRDDTGAEAV